MDLALFDFDGTITFCDSFTAFLLYSSTPSQVARGTVSLGPLMCRVGMRRASFAELRRAAVMEAFRGRDLRELTELGERFSREQLPRMVRPRALERIAWHQQRRDHVVVVSASLDLYLAGFCRRMGLDLLSSQLEVAGGVFTGRYLGADCAGRAKARRVLERYALDRFGEVYAYGDTKEDRELLELAHHRFMRWRPV